MSENIATDLATRDRAASVLAKVQVNYPSYTLAEVYTGALGVGLNVYSGLAAKSRVLDNGAYRPLAAEDFDPTEPATLDDVSVTVTARDQDRADEIAAAFDVFVEHVRSKALCTGLAFLDGDEEYLGPFAAA